MKKIIPLFLIIITSNAFTQTRRVYEHFAFGFGDAKKVAAPSFAYTQTIGLGKDNAYRIGSGIRMNGFYTKNRDFEGVETKINKVIITPRQQYGANSLNIPIIAEFHSKKLSFGVNLDLLGFSFGGRKDSLSYKNYVGKLDSLSSNPSGISLQLFGKKSRGTLNSEIYVGYDLADEITIRMGAAMMRSSFSAEYIPQSGKETTLGRFTMNQIMPFISVVLNIER
jgi:hypothetical protein